MIDHLTAICAQTMRRPIKPDDDLIEQGLNANRALKIIRTFWDDTGIELDVNVFYAHRTVRALVAAIEHRDSMVAQKIMILRAGDPARPLFLYAGGVNCFLEMQDLIDALAFDGVIDGISLTAFDRAASHPAVVSDEIAASHAALKTLCPQGPYRFAGYSFGGVFALELARKLRADGDAVAFLAMIDSPQNDHSWRWRDWAGLMLTIVRRQIRSRLQGRAGRQRSLSDGGLSRDCRHSPPRAGHQIFFRFKNPRNPRYPTAAPQWAGGYPHLYDKAARQLLQMKGLFRPKAYDGRVLFFHSRSGSPVDCDARTVWERYLPDTQWISVAGNHLSMMVGRNAIAMAKAIDDGLRADGAIVQGAQTVSTRDGKRSEGKGSAASGRATDGLVRSGDGLRYPEG